MSACAGRAPLVGRITAEEVALAMRDSGLPLEALRYDVTPAGLHDLPSHFDVPAPAPCDVTGFGNNAVQKAAVGVV